MILTGHEITKQVSLGNITIDPFDIGQINPNSYNYRLGNSYVLVSESDSLCGEKESTELLDIPARGLCLQPGRVYLSTTVESLGSNKFVTFLIGRSSVGRLGLFLQISADLGNLGPAHRWTLELTCVQPVIVYPGMRIGQVTFWIPTGKIKEYIGQYTDYSVPKHSIHRLLRGES